MAKQSERGRLENLPLASCTKYVRIARPSSVPEKCSFSPFVSCSAVSADIQATLYQSQGEIKAHVDRSIEASREGTVKAIESSRDATTAEVKAVLTVSHQVIIAHLDQHFVSMDRPIAGSIPQNSEGSSRATRDRIAYQAGSDCSLDCGCQCHSPIRYRWDINSLKMLIGSVCLEYRNHPARPCTTSQCQGQANHAWRNIRIQYKLPT